LGTALRQLTMAPLKDWLDCDGALLRLRLARPKANIVDAEMIGALHGALVAHGTNRSLRGVLLDAEGPHFSFGASVEEHLPDRYAQMLASLHELIIAMIEFPVPILVAVRGQCLGGGLEVALAGQWIFAAPDAQFGQPEMKLGVFAPAASVLLPYRVHLPMAEDLLYSGRSIGAPVALACATAAARGAMRRDVRQRLADVERLYLDRLMATRDANEGLVAFLAKRKPNWEHR